MKLENPFDCDEGRKAIHGFVSGAHFTVHRSTAICTMQFMDGTVFMSFLHFTDDRISNEDRKLMAYNKAIDRVVKRYGAVGALGHDSFYCNLSKELGRIVSHASNGRS